MRPAIIRTGMAVLAVLSAVLACDLPVAGQIPPVGGVAAKVADLAARRAKVMASLGPETVAVLWSAPTRVFSADVNYEYRQDSHFLYLSGFAREDSVLVLVPGARTRKEFLFIRAVDPVRALWFGGLPTPTEAAATTGIANVVAQRGTEAFDAFIGGLFSGTLDSSPAGSSDEFGAVVAAVRTGTAKLAILGRPEGDARSSAESGRDPSLIRARELRQRHPSVQIISIADRLMAARQIKTPYEQQVLRRSVEISAEAHVEGMRATRPGRWEYEIEAVIESWFHRNGALAWGYPSIVGSGPNATTLHYLDATRQMVSGDLLLVDAAGSYQGLTGDITRTYPVNGRFTPAQRAIYDLVLRAQQAGIAAARPGRPVEEVVTAIRTVFGTGLAMLGLVTADATGDALDREINLWFPHGPVHGIGMDVHEPIATLDVGSAFVIEPGLYIRSDALERASDSRPSTDAIARLRPALVKYRDIGVRIEDSFLMTPSGPLMLSAKAPRGALEIERVVGKGR